MLHFDDDRQTASCPAEHMVERGSMRAGREHYSARIASSGSTRAGREHYSARSASSGSTRDARATGTSEATSATSASSAATPPNVSGSDGATP